MQSVIASPSKAVSPANSIAQDQKEIDATVAAEKLTLKLQWSQSFNNNAQTVHRNYCTPWRSDSSKSIRT